jgi:diaminohydroxyphosphoribosylaminopyrimidine deaminase/5-amino-6-(5-phosphoribosylamino)uracil reductase
VVKAHDPAFGGGELVEFQCRRFTPPQAGSKSGWKKGKNPGSIPRIDSLDLQNHPEGSSGFSVMTQEQCMKLTINLAKKGRGKTSPNPMVGALVVKNGEIVGRGYHKRFGQFHAEANALIACRDKAKDATLYVNLEPCCHHGKTPPCTDMIIKSGIRKVVCATLDPNSQVNGRGIKALREGGVEVHLGVLEREAKELNEVYMKFITTGLPFVMLKVAQTLDGKIATKLGDSKWITNQDSRGFVHSLRASVDAVLVGANTVKRDDPELTIHGAVGDDPIRIIMDSSGKIPHSLKIVKENKDGKTVIATANHKTMKEFQEGVNVWKLKKRKGDEVDLAELLKKAGENQITSLLVEGGRKVFTSFLKEKLVDKIYYFLSPKILGDGLDSFGDLGIEEISDSIMVRDCQLKKFKDDILIIGYPVWRS